MEWLLFFLPILSLSVNVLIQIITVRLVSQISISIIVGIVIGLMIDIGLVYKLMITSSIVTFDDVIVNLLTYIALSLCFFAFLNLNITSLRIRILREFLTKNEQVLRAEQILSLYSPQELIDRRLKRLKNAGQIVQIDDKLLLRSNKLLIFVLITTLLRKLIVSKR